MHPPIKKHRVHVPLRPHLLKLVRKGLLADEIAPVFPESAEDGNVSAGKWLPASIHAFDISREGGEKELGKPLSADKKGFFELGSR
jgi:hypothetical protein